MGHLQEARRIHFRALKLVEELFLGAYRSKFKGTGIEFDEARPFVNGDELRSIDWKLTAKTGIPYVKLFKEERELSVILLIDISKSLLFGSKLGETKRDIARELGTLIALSAVKNFDKIGLILFSGEVEFYLPPRKGIQHVDRIVSELLKERELKKEGTDLAKALLFLNKVSPKRSIVFLLTDFIAPPYEKLLKMAALRHELLAIRITHPEENKTFKKGLLRLFDLESGKEMLLDTTSSHFQKLFSERGKEMRDTAKKNVEKGGAAFIEIHVGESIYEPLARAFHK